MIESIPSSTEQCHMINRTKYLLISLVNFIYYPLKIYFMTLRFVRTKSYIQLFVDLHLNMVPFFASALNSRFNPCWCIAKFGDYFGKKKNPHYSNLSIRNAFFSSTVSVRELFDTPIYLNHSHFKC